MRPPLSSLAALCSSSVFPGGLGLLGLVGGSLGGGGLLDLTAIDFLPGDLLGEAFFLGGMPPKTILARNTGEPVSGKGRERGGMPEETASAGVVSASGDDGNDTATLGGGAAGALQGECEAGAGGSDGGGRPGTESRASCGSVETEDLPSSRPKTGASTKSGLGLRPESVPDEAASTELSAQPLDAAPEMAESQIWAAQELTASGSAPNEDLAAQAPRPSASANASTAGPDGAGLIGRRTSVRREMPPPVDLEKVLEDLNSAGQDGVGAEVTQDSRSNGSKQGSSGGSSPVLNGLPSPSPASLTPASLSRHNSSNSSPSNSSVEEGRRRRNLSPQSEQQLQKKMADDLCARSVHACARYGNVPKLQEHIAANAALCNDKVVRLFVISVYVCIHADG